MKLIVFGDGKAILELPADVRPEYVDVVRTAWREWAQGEGAQLLMIPGPVELEAELLASGELEVREVPG